MRIRLGELRTLIREAADSVVFRAELETIARSRKPFLSGQWTRGPRLRGFTADVYVATDDAGRELRLVIDSDVTYKNTGRLRDPAKTKCTWRAIVAFDANDSPFNGVTFVEAKAVGEGGTKKHDAETKFRQAVMKIFGFDPFTWAGPL